MESCVLLVLTRIHNIGHIHNTNFAQSQFSMSYTQKTRSLRNWEFTFFWKYLVCGFKIEISEYPTKLLYVTYTPYKYELHRTKTHEDRANQKTPFAILNLLTDCPDHNLLNEVYQQYKIQGIAKEVIKHVFRDKKYIFWMWKRPANLKMENVIATQTTSVCLTH